MRISPAALLDPPSVVASLMTPGPTIGTHYFEGKPDKTSIALIQSLIPSAAKARQSNLPDEDWLTIAGQGLSRCMPGASMSYIRHDAPLPRGESLPDRGEPGLWDRRARNHAWLP
jgi:hypothetical protein